MAMAVDEALRTQLIEEALKQALERQSVEKVADLDLTKLAVDIEAVIGAERHPLDPEGDGLTTGELNAANDL
ncbi:MAG TPA: hypothetical protein VGV07_14735 [Devosia sp.]|jgi:hypothetical protein|uniref:hypothetical protein n=1 Tax=Devosia sp. TaxID=1871048 RepID=UPI002DDD4ED6|nr:hypothetical protein [Devosia sp.]HEV2516509.1 hypothetical protein [Devosia sp.]